MTVTAQAIETNHCQPVIEDCKDAINKADAVIKAQDAVIESQHLQIQNLNSNLQRSLEWGNAQKDLANVWYKDPFIVVPAAMLAGFLANEALRSGR